MGYKTKDLLGQFLSLFLMILLKMPEKSFFLMIDRGGA